MLLNDILITTAAAVLPSAPIIIEYLLWARQYSKPFACITYSFNLFNNFIR